MGGVAEERGRRYLRLGGEEGGRGRFGGGRKGKLRRAGGPRKKYRKKEKGKGSFAVRGS